MWTVHTLSSLSLSCTKIGSVAMVTGYGLYQIMAVDLVSPPDRLQVKGFSPAGREDDRESPTVGWSLYSIAGSEMLGSHIRTEDRLLGAKGGCQLPPDSHQANGDFGLELQGPVLCQHAA